MITGWQPGSEIDAYQALRVTARRVVMRTLFGERLRGQADELGQRLQPALDYVNLPMPQHMHVGMLLAARRSRRHSDALVYSEIAQRRNQPTDADDVLTWLLANDELTDLEIRDQVVSLIAAGYETTSAAMGWAVFAALAHDGVWDSLAAEVAARAGDASLTAETLRAVPYLDAFVNETLRLWPPGIVAGRQTLAPLTAGEYEIPAGRVVLYSPYVTHRLADLWPDPLVFRPERWIAGSPHHHEPSPYAYVPFGAGPRRCIGFALALTEIKVAIVELVRSATLTLLERDLGREGVASMRPKRGVRVRVEHVAQVQPVNR